MILRDASDNSHISRKKKKVETLWTKQGYFYLNHSFCRKYLLIIYHFQQKKFLISRLRVRGLVSKKQNLKILIFSLY